MRTLADVSQSAEELSIEVYKILDNEIWFAMDTEVEPEWYEDATASQLVQLDSLKDIWNKTIGLKKIHGNIATDFSAQLSGDETIDSDTQMVASFRLISKAFEDLDVKLKDLDDATLQTILYREQAAINALWELRSLLSKAKQILEDYNTLKAQVEDEEQEVLHEI